MLTNWAHHADRAFWLTKSVKPNIWIKWYLVLVGISSADFLLILGGMATPPPRGSRASSGAAWALAHLPGMGSLRGDSRGLSVAGQSVGVGAQHGSCQLLMRHSTSREGAVRSTLGPGQPRCLSVGGHARSCAGIAVLCPTKWGWTIKTSLKRRKPLFYLAQAQSYPIFEWQCSH